MADPSKLIARIRSFGSNVILDGPKLVIINDKKLPAGALDHIKAHGKEIAAFLEREAEFEERAAIIEFDGGLTRTSAEYITKLLMTTPPDGADRADWSWFVGEAAKVIDHELRRAAA